MTSATNPPAAEVPSTAPTHGALERAAEWFAQLRSGEATDADHARWQAWLDASSEHRAAWAFVERVSSRFAPIQCSVDPRSTVRVLHPDREGVSSRRRLLSIAAAAGTGTLGWAVWRHTALPDMVVAWTSDQHTTTGEVREVRLSDGTRVWLGSASAFDEDYRPSVRRLRLRAGDIFIETAADVSRPFVVDTPHGRLRALGTRFHVRLSSPEESAVAVYEGAVEVRPIDTGSAAVLSAGQQTRFSPSGVLATTVAEPGGQAWTRGILIAQDLSLGEVISELRRYRHGHLGIAPEVAGLRVHGSFPLNDTDRALSMLARVMPIHVRQPLPWWTTVEREDRSPER